MGVVNKVIKRVFYRLGECIAKSPKYFIICPIILTFILLTGVFRFKYLNDPNVLYTESNGRTQYEKKAVDRLFPSNYHGRFDPSRLSTLGRFARIIVTAKDDESSILTKNAWEEILTLDSLLHGVTINWNGETFNYSSLCANWFDNCYENEFLDLTDEIVKIESNETSKLSYPVAFNPKTYKTHILPQFFGGVRLKANNFSVEAAKAVLLNYVIAVGSPEDDDRALIWEREILKFLNVYEPKWVDIKVRGMVYQSWADEIDGNVLSVFPHFFVTSILMSIFTIVTSLNVDCVRSKPWLGFTGVISSLLGTAAGGGFLFLVGVPLMGLNIAVPFIMLGIGIDDTFVMLASWKRTSPEDSVPKRMAECYSDAAVSVTITTLTDMSSFYIGIITPFPSVQLFSYYAGTCILCIYFYQLFFFGGIMAISGYHEALNRHCAFWWIEATPKSKAENLPKWKQLFFVGGVEKANPNINNGDENFMMAFFRDSFSTFLFNPVVKILVLVSFVAYIFIAAWGITTMEVGFQFDKTVRFDSYVADFVLTELKYFRQYPYRVQVIVDTPLDYSVKENRDKIANLLQEFYKIEQISDKWTENWLRDFTLFVENYKEFYEFNITNEQQFINTLRNDYLNEKSPISLDVLFNENKTQILASRYIIQSQIIQDSLDADKNLLIQLRNVCEEAEKLGLNVTIYHPWFHFLDQQIVIVEITTQLVAAAAVIVMFVTIIFIPNIICAICVLFTIVSIEIGVLGCMCLWGVSLDFVTVTSLIMCIGFSVDFSAHISYTFITSEADTTEDKMKDAMYSLGLPILQGGISTIIGIGALLFAPSYVLQVFFKITVLVIVFAVWHALFILPVLLLLLKPDSGFSFKRKSFTVNTIFDPEEDLKMKHTVIVPEIIDKN